MIAEIGKGLLVLLGVEKGDSRDDGDYLAEKIVNLRIFQDQRKKMNKSLIDIQGELLVVSQFTLAGNVKRGRRPSFDQAEDPDAAEELYTLFVEKCREQSVATQCGRFRASMDVELINTGPVTMLMSSRKEF